MDSAQSNSQRAYAQESLPRLLGCFFVFAYTFACSDAGSDRPPAANSAYEDEQVEEPGGDRVKGEVGLERCVTPQTGCSCKRPGETIDCGRVVEEHGDYITCMEGTRTCNGEKEWSECQGERQTIRPASERDLLALGTQKKCPVGFDRCDPYCHLTEDTPVALDTLPDGFVETDAGLTLAATLSASCTDLDLAASTSQLTVTQFTPLSTVPPEAVSFTLAGTPAGCAPDTFPATWTVDKPDRAFIKGDSSTNGELTLVDPFGGTLRATAFALGISRSVELKIKVNVLVAEDKVAPNQEASSTARYSAFGPANAPVAGTTDSTVDWLYPYADTFFPLGLPPPTLMYWYTSTAGDGSSGSPSDRNVKISLRYPANSSADPAAENYSEFNYSMIVRESNALSTGVGMSEDTRDPQVLVPAVAWDYFERTARGKYADLLIQRNRAGIIEQESRRRIFFVDGQLKGRVVYNTYNSPLASGGAILSIEPGATTPVVAAQPAGKCTACHSVSRNGKNLIANGFRAPGNNWYNQSRRYDISDSSTFPAPPVLQSYTHTKKEGNYTGNAFTWGGPWGDEGLLYMTHGGCSPGANNGDCANSTDGDRNWRAPRRFSNLYSVEQLSDVNRGGGDPPPIALGNWPNNVLAITPRFSPNDKLLAFGFWGGDPIDGLAPDAAGRTLAVVDFSCASPPCTPSSTGWMVSNARNVTPGLNMRFGWPSFSPRGNAVVYQAMYRTARSQGYDPVGVAAGFPEGAIDQRDGGGAFNWSASHINTIAGALAEVWISDLPNSGNSTPTVLRNLNGLNPSGTGSYLPEDDRVVSPLPTTYHRNSGLDFDVRAADRCSYHGIAEGVKDTRLNYLPFMAPTEAGGMTWVVFTSRRMFGNFAVNTPWDGKLGHSCYTGTPSTKKLWIAAIDPEWVPGEDPSHPAFYLEGQELFAGNNDGYWARSPCTAIGGPCETTDDCCDGTGPAATTECRIAAAPTALTPVLRTCTNKNSCSVLGEECSTASNCCTGLLCPEGGGLCFLEPDEAFTRQVMTREYVADCAVDEGVRWRFFEWQATMPATTSMDVLVETKEELAASYQPAPPLPMITSTATTPEGIWHHGPDTVHEVLEAASPPLTSMKYLRVSIALNPGGSGSIAPTLRGWRQIFDCVPIQ